MYTKIFLSFLGIILYFSSISDCYVQRIDTADNDFEANDWYFDHLESRKFFQTEQELIGVWSSAQNNPPIGVWVFESLGPGGCCGGLWEPRSPYFNTTDTFELLIRFVSNVDVQVNAYYKDGSIETISSERITIPPNNATVINWRTELFRISQGTRFIRLTSNFAYAKTGYLLLEKLILAVNEAIPIGDLQI